MDSITLTPHQQAAVDWLVAKLVAGQKLLALRGYAGTGKTSLVPALQEALRAHGLPSVIGAPTHRATMILRQKGLEAETIHAHALVPYFTADYRRACAWLGEDLPRREGVSEADPRADVEGLPWLVYEAVTPDLERGKALKRQRRYKAQRRLASLGISGKDHFAGFGPKVGEGVLIIDEASMVGEALLAICQAAYRQIILVGDPGQLPPVKDEAMLAQVEGVDLSEVHRQAQDSPIVQLAYQARAGEAFWHTLEPDPFSGGTPVRAVDEVSASRFRTCPLLVWRNVTRTTSTQAIRAALGYTREALHVGEPLVCRSTAQEDRVLGFFNNGLYTITEVSPDDPRLITVKDALGDVQAIRAHVEELDGDFIDPRAIPFRFGYALTVHTAQGGEWPRVYVSLPDLRAYAAFAHRTDPESFAQWAYTAITRAKTHLRFVTQHTFTPPHERTRNMAETPQQRVDESPALLVTAPTVEERLAANTPPVGMVWNINTPAPPAGARPATPEETAIFGDDDILDPAVPLELQNACKDDEDTTQESIVATPATSTQFGEHEALLQGFCQHLLRKFDEGVQALHKELTKPVDEIYGFVHQQLQIQREKAQHAETYLDTLTTKAVDQGLQLRHDPYTVTVQTLSPQGFAITLGLAKQNKGELVEELGAMVQWLAHNGYKPVG